VDFKLILWENLETLNKMRTKKQQRFNSEAVVKVGAGGRGFIIEHHKEYPPFEEGKPSFMDRRLVITAAHCLPRIPRNLFDRKPFRNLIGKLNTSRRGVWAQCLFVDPVADIAILCEPDAQIWHEEHEAYLEMMEDLQTLRIGAANKEGQVWLLALDGEWIPCMLVEQPHGSLGLFLEATSKNQSGMSGSPILGDDGSAVAVLSRGCNQARHLSRAVLSRY